MTDRDLRVQGALARIVAAYDGLSSTVYGVGVPPPEDYAMRMRAASDEHRAALAHARDVLAGEREPEAESSPFADTPLVPEEHDGPYCTSTCGTKTCVRPIGHDGLHMSRTGSAWPMTREEDTWRRAKNGTWRVRGG